jgi:hypothetical protein
VGFLASLMFDLDNNLEDILCVCFYVLYLVLEMDAIGNGIAFSLWFLLHKKFSLVVVEV